MRLLLDTHTAVWLLGKDARVSERALDHFADEIHDVLLSAAVVWEVAIKRSLGKLDAPNDMVDQLSGVGVRPLPITLEHAAAVEALPPHHRDPFDRILVAQALSEDAAIISRDERFARYGVTVIW